MQIDRLFQIVQILLNKKNVTAKELSQRFGVSTRTIYRDIDTLSINGVPIYAIKGKGGGIRMMENYTMDQSLLSDTEKNNILLGLETLKATQATDVGNVLDKFKDIFKQDHHNWIRVDFSHWGNDPAERRKFEDVKSALISYHAVAFNYYDAYGNHTSRRVYPIQLLFKEKAWYLIGYCREKEDFRFFKLMRMADVAIMPEPFEPASYPLKEDLLYNAPSVVGEKYLFWVSEQSRYRIFDDFHRDQIKQLPDGNFQVTYYGKEDAWLYGFVLSYGEHLRVLEPTSLRRTMLKKIEEMKDNYL